MLLLIRPLTDTRLRRLYILLLLSCLNSAFMAHAQCLSVRRSGNVVQTMGDAGTIEIRNPENVKARDNNYATARSLVSIGIGSEVPTQELEIKDFRFSIPEPSIICGVEVRIKRRANSFLGLSIGSAGPKDKQVMLLKNGSTVGVNASQQSLWSSDDTYTVYGGSRALWGTTLTTADVNSPNFGVSLAANFTALVNVSAMPSAEIDHVEIEVFYQPVVVLPVKLNNFKASINNGQIALGWNLTNPDAGTTIFVQRSKDGRKWETIHQLHSNPEKEVYHHIDQPRKPGTYYYRLQMVSPAGHLQYSKETTINWNALGNNSFFIQKANTLFIQRTANNTLVQLFNSNGQPVHYNSYTSTQWLVLDISHLATGIYILQVGNRIEKFLKP